MKPDNWKQLIIALEPEAASIYCQSLHARETSLRASREKILSSPSLTNGVPKYRSRGESGNWFLFPV